MRRFVLTFLGVVVVVALIAGPVVFALHEQRQTRNFRVVREGVLYRSGQMSEPGLKRVLHDYLIRTVVTLRDKKSEDGLPPDLAEERYCQEQGIKYVRIPPRTWGGPDGDVPAEEGVRTFREVMSDPRNYPVLVHCFAGIHRTGAYTAIYRMELEHWSNEQAIAEMIACGCDTFYETPDIRGYLEGYVPSWRVKEETPPEPAKDAKVGRK
jgi:protein tyrosine/serine phosphatase